MGYNYEEWGTDEYGDEDWTHTRSFKTLRGAENYGAARIFRTFHIPDGHWNMYNVNRWEKQGRFDIHVLIEFRSKGTLLARIWTG